MAARRRVCLFGLSGDPPTVGHLGIVRALTRLDFDEIRVIPVYQHMFANKRGRLSDFEHRMTMCRLAFADWPSVVVGDDEYRCWQAATADCHTDKARTQAPVGTATVLEYLHRTEPSTDFHFCLGADAYADLMAGRWRQSQRVWELLEDRLWVVGRPGVKVDAKDGGAHGVEVELADVSSSQARACQSVQELDGLVVRAVRDYIVEHRLYGFGDDQP